MRQASGLALVIVIALAAPLAAQISVPPDRRHASRTASPTSMVYGCAVPASTTLPICCPGAKRSRIFLRRSRE